MELLSGLQTEQHRCKELATRLGQQEEELKDMREQVPAYSKLLCVSKSVKDYFGTYRV